MERRSFLGSVIGLAFKAEPINPKIIDPFDKIKQLARLMLLDKDELMKYRLAARFNFTDKLIVMPPMKSLRRLLH